MLPWNLMTSRLMLPHVKISKWLIFLAHVFLLKILKKYVDIERFIGTKRVKKLNALFLHECHRTHPVTASMVDGKDYLIQLEEVPTRNLPRPPPDIPVLKQSVFVRIFMVLIEQLTHKKRLEIVTAPLSLLLTTHL